MKTQAQKSNSDYIEVNVSSNLYTEPDKNNKQKLIKKNIITRLSIYIYDIGGHEEIIDQKGRILKDTCRLYHKNIGQMVVKKSYDEITQIKNSQHNPQTKFIGFNGNKSK